MHRLLLAREAMATRFEVVAHGERLADLRAAMEAALDVIGVWEDRLSLFRASSEVSRINRDAAFSPVRLDPEVYDLLARAREWWRITGGAFDITVDPLMRCWGFRTGTPGCLGAAAVEAARECVGMEWVELDPGPRTVRFLRSGVQLDLGGIAKGFAVECAGEVLRDAGVTSALVHGGTSTVLAMGCPEGAAGWEIALPALSMAGGGPRAAELVAEDPREEGRVLTRVRLRDEALSVSARWGGGAGAGARVAHVMDPRTGRPVEDVHLAAAIGPSATDADAISTALLVGGEAVQRLLAGAAPCWRSLLGLPSDAPSGWRVATAGWPSDQ